MAWIYLAVSEESALPWQVGSNPSPIVKTIDMPNPSYYLECEKEHSPMRPSGIMCGPYMGLFFLLWTLFMGDSHARILALQETEQAWKESEADFSSKLSDLQMKLTRRLCSLKMSQQLELGDFEKSSDHLPIFGITVDGHVYLPLNLEPHILEKGGSYLPTPTVNDASNRAGQMSQAKRDSPGLAYLCDPTGITGGQLSPQWVEWLMGYPLGYTELSAWATQWYRSKQGKLLKGS